MFSRLPALIALVLLFSSSLLSASRDEQWAKVEHAISQRLPKTAIEELTPIIAGALADKSYAEATKAIARKIVLEGEIEGGTAEEQITRLEKQMANLPAPMRPMMTAILAHWYWSYYQENRWTYLQRTATTGEAGPDIRTWDLKRVLAEIDRHFTAALDDEKLLQSTPISAFDDLLERGTVPDAYRPTLFDFLAHEALKFYQAGEQGAVEAEDTFTLDPQGPIFGPAVEFLRWQPVVTDTASPHARALRLHQALLRFHQNDADRSAWFDADLARLAFGFEAAAEEDKAEQYHAALEHFIEATENHEISARARAILAQALYDAGNPARAHEVAQRGRRAFPHSAGAATCFNIIQSIEAPHAQITTESVWAPPLPTLNVTYRNLTRVYFRAVRLPYEQYLKEARWNLGHFSRDQADRLIATTPALEWSAELPRTRDFKSRTEKLPTPASLPPGFYAILSSHDAGFGTDENQLSVTSVWVSNLALITQSRADGRSSQGFVLHAETGEPVAGATVRAWQRDRRRGEYEAMTTLPVDADGRFEFPKAEQQYLLLAEHNGQAVSTQQLVYQYNRRNREPASTRTVLFTDRALYRPGQIINYKGICLRTDAPRGDYAVLAREKVSLIFSDQNGQEIARASAVTNAHGSFSGVFTAPRDRVLGQVAIRVEGTPQGQTFFRVEEYKRPKFEVELAAPVEAPKLGEPVTLTGKALAYTGAALGGSKVKWNVIRRATLPPWCWWRETEQKAIAHGTTTTAPDGSFQIQFPATPDRSIAAKLEPVFTYQVHADVTDATGETRSGERSVAAGYVALRADVTTGDWQTPAQPVEMKISTRSLDDVPLAAAGKLTIHALNQPAKVARTSLHGEAVPFDENATEPPFDPTKPDTWPAGVEVARRDFKTDAAGTVKLSIPLPAGIYRASLETTDRFGRRVTARRIVEVTDPDAGRYPVKVPNFFAARKWSVEPGETFVGLWGTGYETGRAFVEIEYNGQPVQSFWTNPDRTQQRFELPITEAMRGGVSVNVTFVRENRAYFNNRTISVPWSNKELSVKWETFRSKLLPGQAETWTALISGPGAVPGAAEMAATLYDASLDQFQTHAWPAGFNVFRTEQRWAKTYALHNSHNYLTTFASDWSRASRPDEWSYRSFPDDLTRVGHDRIVLSAFTVGSGRPMRAMATAAAPAPAEAQAGDASGKILAMELPASASASRAGATFGAAAQATTMQKPNLDGVTARRNLNETAFFFPHLLADANGTVKLQFTMPEALTRWKFLGFAHDKELRAGLLTGETVTAKDLMVQPNPPRFVREGDAIEFTVKVSNQSDQPQSGQVRLTFADAATLAPVDAALGNQATEQTFNVPAKESRTYSWRIAIPDGMGFLTYKAVGATNEASDGEEGFLPVLSRRILVTESLPLPIRGKTTKEFDFAKLAASGQSNTLRHQSLTVQMVSQPAWYAVMALPYLMEFPYECSEQIFSRLYANALARHIANSDPKIRRIFDQWKGTPTLDSPLNKNEDLKSVMLEETPWLRQANKESESRRNVGLLFDANRLDEESARAIQQLTDQQLANGLWSWFPGGSPNEYISLTIVTGFGRLRHLGVQIDDAPALRALPQLDAWLTRRYREIQRGKQPENYVPNSTDALYLYGRSLFLANAPVAQEHQAALDFFLQQARLHWTKLGNRQSEAHLALGLHRFGDRKIPTAIAKSLKERSVSNEELGMFWRDAERSWWWWHAPIETQAMMIEVFAEITRDQQAVEDCQVWLLKQKQTQDWKTTRATADAIYGLLLQGGNLLKSDAIVEVALGGTTIKPARVEAGTGFYEQKFIRDEIKPAMGRITVKKSDEGVSWGSAHWQYLEDMAKVTPHEGTPLQLKKALFIKETTAAGPVLKPVTGPVAVGDELVVRLELRADRDMEYVHLKDQRGSGTEPVNVLSQYKHQDGLGYYESTRDTASHFFIDYLRKGTYVFEYSVRVQLRGRYESGIAGIQCMYAPEFNSHSGSVGIEVR